MIALGSGRNGATTTAGQVTQRPRRFTQATNRSPRLRVRARLPVNRLSTRSPHSRPAHQ